jgi:arginyl-tRNA synthetase
MLLESYLEPYVREALDRIGAGGLVEPEFEVPRLPEHGDLATTVALQLARHLRRPPRQIAEELLAQLRLPGEEVTAEVAGAGFLNFRFSPTFYTPHACAHRLRRRCIRAAPAGRGQTCQRRVRLRQSHRSAPSGARA